MLRRTLNQKQPIQPAPPIDQNSSPDDIASDELADKVFKMALSEGLGLDSFPLQCPTSCTISPAQVALKPLPLDSFAAIWLLDVEIATRFQGGLALKKVGLDVAAKSKEAARTVVDLKELRQWFLKTKDHLEPRRGCESMAEELRCAVVNKLAENIAEVDAWIVEVKGMHMDLTASSEQLPVIDTSKSSSNRDHQM